jgi:uncharacterized protein YhfF
MQPVPTIAEFIAKLRSTGIELPDGPVRTDQFGDSAELSTELLSLIIHGNKRGGAGLLWAYEYDQEATAQVGDIVIVLDHLHNPRVITKTTGVEIVPFSEVSAEFATREAEGDGSLEYWRTEHWRFFQRECARIGRVIDKSMPVVCESFDVIKIL